MRIIDYVLITEYLVSIACSLYIILAHAPYFKERFAKGAVSLFMLAMLFFLCAYTVKMVTAVWMRVGNANELTAITIETYAWTIAQAGTTAGLVILAVLTFTKRFDLFVKLKNFDKKTEKGL